MTRILALLILWTLVVWSADEAGRLGRIWHSQAHPWSGVTIEFADGQTKSGYVSKQWDGSYVVTDTAGASRVFSAHGFRSWSSTLNFERTNALPWRAILPPALILIVGAIVSWAGVRTTFTRN